MSKLKVFITREIPQEGLSLIREQCEVDIWQDDMPPSREVLRKQIKEVDGLLCLLTDRIDEQLILEAKNLKVISNYAVGYNNIDIKAARAKGIAIGNTPDILTDTTADLAFALILAAARRLHEGALFVKEGKWKSWEPRLMLGADIHGARLGVIGMGRIGQAVAKRAKGFDMNIGYTDYKNRRELGDKVSGELFSSIDELLKWADFVSIHIPMEEKNCHMINETTLGLMKPSAILVNTSRGDLVDSEALYRALKNNIIAGAALDVTDPEPIPVWHPLLSLPNCLIVPHIGSASKQTRTKMAIMAAENLLVGLRSEPLPYPVPE